MVAQFQPPDDRPGRPPRRLEGGGRGAGIAVEHLSQGQDWALEGKPTVEDILDHIDHAVRIAGVDHVGLGADMYPRTPSPEGLRGVQDYANITRGLKRRGYSDDDIRKIMGGNMLRVWKAATDPR